MTCEPCVFAVEHGWWGPSVQGTHCGGCHRTWAGWKESHCAGCHESFSSEAVFTIHQRDGRCLSPGELDRLVTEARNPVLARKPRQGGSVWVRWRSEGHVFAGEGA